MDNKEFLKVEAMFCESQLNCWTCPIKKIDEEKLCCVIRKTHPEECVAIIEEWWEKNKPMTNADYVAKGLKELGYKADAESLKRTCPPQFSASYHGEDLECSGCCDGCYEWWIAEHKEEQPKQKKVAKLTKKRIEKMADEVINALAKKDMLTDCSLWYNGKRISYNWNYYTHELEKHVEENRYADYKPTEEKYIFCLTFDGSDLYDYINYKKQQVPFLNKIFKKYGLRYEQYYAWDLSCYPDSISEEDIEYTYAKDIC